MSKRMSDEEFTALIEGIEDNLFKYDHQYADAFRQLGEENKGSLTSEQEFAIKNENIAFRFMTRDTTKKSNPDRLVPMFGYTDGTSWPDPKDVANGDLAYYIQRAKITKNIVMKYRYLDIIWELYKGRGRHIHGKDLVVTAIEASSIERHGNELERVDCLNRALQVATQLGRGNEGLVKKSVDAITEYLEAVNRSDNVRYALELIDTVAAFKGNFSDRTIKLCDEICKKTTARYATEGKNMRLRSAFINRQYIVKRILDPQSKDKKEKAKELAQVNVEEAERRIDSVMVQQHFLAEAQKIYRDAGLTQEAKDMGKRIEKLGKETDQEKEFKSVSFTQRIPKEYIDTIEKILREVSDVSAAIAISAHFIPRWSTALESAAKEEQTFISDLMTSVTYNDDGVPIAISDGDSEERRKAMRYYQIDVELKLTLLSNAIKKLIDEGTLSIDGFETQFSKIKHIDQSTWKSVQYGLERLFDGDPYSASLILTTQLEDFLFKLLPIMEIEQYIQEPDGKTYSPKTLKMILSDAKAIIGDDLYELMRYTLIDKAHLNYRNLVGHGKTKVTDQTNFVSCVRIIQLFSALLVHVNPSTEQESN